MTQFEVYQSEGASFELVIPMIAYFQCFMILATRYFELRTMFKFAALAMPIGIDLRVVGSLQSLS